MSGPKKGGVQYFRVFDDLSDGISRGWCRLN
jgi:hypothetical protein